MGEPTNAERGLNATTIEDPAFLEWARKQGKPVNRATPFNELRELLAQYEYEQREKARRAEEDKRRKAEEAQRTRATAGYERVVRTFAPTGIADADDRLREKIKAGWRTGGSMSLKAQAEKAVNNAVPLSRWLYGSHGADDDKERWAYMRYYLIALNTAFGDGPPDEATLLDMVLREEKIYLAKKQRAEKAAAKAMQPALQRKALLSWARKQPMNPADNFEPGIAFYDFDAAMAHADWIDKGVSEIEVDRDDTVISYSKGKSLRFPSKLLDFDGKYERSIEELFVRRHKATRRLVPFAIYNRNVDLYNDLPTIDALPSKDRVYMALPYMMTPMVMAFYMQDSYLAGGLGLLKVLRVMTLYRALPLGAPTTVAVVTTAGQMTARGVALGRSVVAEVTFAVRTYGVGTQAAAYLGRSAYTYYLTNAVAVNTSVIVGTDIALAIAGQDMGPMSPGDVLNMATQVDDVAKAGANSWKRLTAEVIELDAASGKAVVRVAKIDSITDDVAKAEYDLGKKVAGTPKSAINAARAVDDPATKGRIAKAPPDPKKPKPPVVPKGKAPAGKGGPKRVPDPRKALPVSELDDAMKKVVKGLDKLGKKYNAKALEKIKNLSADAIRESGIRPSDLAKLPDSLARAGATTQRFVNEFHDAPGFERVLLGWAKRHYWNTKAKKPAWKRTQSFYTGTSYVMKYAVARLDPKFVRFEWPVSINDTRWGDEVFARYVDIVVTGGNRLKPGQRIQIELKSWTEFVLKMKARGATTQPGTVGYQLLRDTALFDPDNIRWVFDGKKVNKNTVLDVFEQLILSDEYLKQHWGGKSGDRVKIRELLDKVIEVF